VARPSFSRANLKFSKASFTTFMSAINATVRALSPSISSLFTSIKRATAKTQPGRGRRKACIVYCAGTPQLGDRTHRQ
jgi:hypothetical protein